MVESKSRSAFPLPVDGRGNRTPNLDFSDKDGSGTQNTQRHFSTFSISLASSELKATFFPAVSRGNQGRRSRAESLGRRVDGCMILRDSAPLRESSIVDRGETEFMNPKVALSS
jgi:hypothetical protein